MYGDLILEYNGYQLHKIKDGEFWYTSDSSSFYRLENSEEKNAINEFLAKTNFNYKYLTEVIDSYLEYGKGLLSFENENKNLMREFTPEQVKTIWRMEAEKLGSDY